MLEQIAKQVHDSWVRTRIEQGWIYGEERNDSLKTHPCLIAYEQLSESEKDVDRATVRQVLTSLFDSGYLVCKDVYFSMDDMEAK